MSNITKLPTAKILEEEGKIISSWSRWTGTGYRSFQAEWQGKVYQVDLNCHNQWDGFFDAVEEIKDPRPARRKFATEMRAMADKYNLSFEVCLALGNEDHIGRVAAMVDFAMQEMVEIFVKENLGHELKCGISRRKTAIIKLIGGVDEINAVINIMGQKNSTRIADELIKKIESSAAYAEAIRFSATDLEISVPASDIDSDGARVWSF